jgi:hypothetical protein
MANTMAGVTNRPPLNDLRVKGGENTDETIREHTRYTTGNTHC